jgi:hypothetical protein
VSKFIESILIEPQRGTSFLLKQSQVVKIIDVEGKQVADLVAFNAEDIKEKLSTGVTLDINESLFVKENDILFSNRYNKMLFVVKDTVGKHDILYPACSPRMYRYQYKIKEYHPSCLENLTEPLKKHGITEDDIPTPFNTFQNSQVSSNGKLTIEEPLSKGEDYIELKAEMNLIVAVSACSVKESKCNAFKCTSIKIEICEESQSIFK